MVYDGECPDVDALVDTIVNSKSIPKVVEATTKLIEASRETRNVPYDEKYWKGLELAWNIILRMRELGYHFRLSWNAYAKKMDVTFIEADKPRNERRQFRGRSQDPYDAVHEAMIHSWGIRIKGEE